MRNQEVIRQEIATLSRLRRQVSQRGVMGGSNQHDIDAQLWVLMNLPADDEIEERFNPDIQIESTLNCYESAIQAQNWLDGEIDEAPSVGWKALAILVK